MAKVNKKVVKSPACRISYPNVFKPQKFNDDKDKGGGKEQYNLVMLISKTEGVTKWQKDPKLKGLVAVLKEAAIEKWGKIPKPCKLPIKDGDKSVGSDGEGPDEAYVGHWAIACTSDRQPGIVAADAQTYLTDEKDFYAGCYAFVSVNGFAWKNKFNKCGCSFGLRNIQKIKDGERLGGIVPAHDDFDPLEDMGDDGDEDFENDDDDLGF